MPRVDRASVAAHGNKPASLDDAGRKKLAKLIEAEAGEGKRFPDLTGGNVGVHGHELTGAKAQLALDLARDGKKLGKDEVVIALALTEDEPSLKLLIIDTKTLAITEAGEYSTYNDPPTAKGGGPDLSEIDSAHFYWLLLKDTPKLPLKNGEDSWSINDYRDTNGPKTMPELAIEKPREPAKTLWSDESGAKYLADKMAKHAGTRFPALDEGKYGTHFYEVTGADARRFNDIAGGYYVAKDDVYVVVLDTQEKQPKLTLLSLDRSDIGKPKIDLQWDSTVQLSGELTAELLKNARELPVPGRREGFSLTALADAGRREAARTVGTEEHRPAAAVAQEERVNATSARIGTFTKPFAEGTGKSVKLAETAAKEMKLHAEVAALDERIQSQRESGDGSGASAYALKPADLKAIIGDGDRLQQMAFDIVCGKDMGELSEYGNFRMRDVGRKGAFAAMGHMLYADHGDEPSYKGTPERKALDKTIGQFLDRLLANKDITKVVHVRSGDAGYGYNEGLLALDDKTGHVYALVNSWAP